MGEPFCARSVSGPPVSLLHCALLLFLEPARFYFRKVHRGIRLCLPLTQSRILRKVSAQAGFSLGNVTCYVGIFEVPPFFPMPTFSAHYQALLCFVSCLVPALRSPVLPEMSPYLHRP